MPMRARCSCSDPQDHGSLPIKEALEMIGSKPRDRWRWAAIILVALAVFLVLVYYAAYFGFKLLLSR